MHWQGASWVVPEFPHFQGEELFWLAGGILCWLSGRGAVCWYCVLSESHCPSPELPSTWGTGVLSTQVSPWILHPHSCLKDRVDPWGPVWVRPDISSTSYHWARGGGHTIWLWNLVQIWVIPPPDPLRNMMEGEKGKEVWLCGIFITPKKHTAHGFSIKKTKLSTASLIAATVTEGQRLVMWLAVTLLRRKHELFQSDHRFVN